MSTSVAAILAVALFPSGGEKIEPMLRCLVCGERGVADFILNVILFLPFGAAVGLTGERLLRACVAGALLSSAIELAQLVVPGRDTSLSDVLSNTTGATLGWLLVRYLPRVSSLTSRAGTVITAGAAALPALGIAATGVLLQPSLPRSTYYGQWTPNLRHLEWYRGRVLAAKLGSLDLPPQQLVNSGNVRTLLLAGALLQIRATAGPAVPRLASLVSVYDDRHREIILLGPDGGDLILRYRTRAAAWRLDQPDLRIPGALASVAPGDPLNISLWRERGGYCLSLNGTRTCHLSSTAGRGWAFLLYHERFAPWLVHVLDGAWLAGLVLPLSYCAQRRRALWTVAALLVSLGVLPPLVGLIPTPLGEWAGGVAGVLGGAGLRAITASWIVHR